MSLDFAAFRPQTENLHHRSRARKGRRLSLMHLHRKRAIHSQLIFCIALSISGLLLSGLILPFLIHLTAGIHEIVILVVWGLYWLCFFRLMKRAEERSISFLGLVGVGAIAVFLQPLPLGHLFLLFRLYPTIPRKFALTLKPSDLLDYDRRIPRVSPQCDNRSGNFQCR
jgi:hypothetical protein